MRSFDVFFDLRLNKLLSKQSWGWWFETQSRPLWRNYNESNFTANALATQIAKFMGPDGPHETCYQGLFSKMSLRIKLLKFIPHLSRAAKFNDLSMPSSAWPDLPSCVTTFVIGHNHLPTCMASIIDSWTASRETNFVIFALLRIANSLTHWGHDKMAAILQTTSTNEFSWRKVSRKDLNFIEFVPNCPINNKIALVEIMAWRHYLNQWEPRVLMHICVTRPQ